MMFKKSQLGWRLAKQSLSILYKLKNAWFLIFFARGIYFLIAMGITLTLWKLKAEGMNFSEISTKILIISYLVILGALFIGNLISSYFDSALMDALLQYDAGINVTARRALKAANKRLWKSTAWISFRLTAGLFLILFFNQLNKIRWIRNLTSGLTWSYASFLVLPLIINEGYNILPAIYHSSRIIKENTSLNPKTNFSLTLLFLIARLICLLPSLVGFFTDNSFLFYLGTVISLLMLLLLTVLAHAIMLAIQQAIYQLLGNNLLPRDFNQKDISEAMK